MSAVTQYYYSNQIVFGANGDFITAPEISQMFGEILGMWCALNWVNAGSPEFAIAELGPGKGTLMSDLLRSTQHIPRFYNSLQSIHLIETSPKLQSVQYEKLKEYSDKIHWHENLKFIT